MLFENKRGHDKGQAYNAGFCAGGHGHQVRVHRRPGKGMQRMPGQLLDRAISLVSNMQVFRPSESEGQGGKMPPRQVVGLICNGCLLIG